MTSTTQKKYVLVEETNDWIDYIVETDYLILATSSNIDILKKYRDTIIASKYGDMMDYYNEHTFSFCFDCSETHFDIFEVDDIK